MDKLSRQDRPGRRLRRELGVVTEGVRSAIVLAVACAVLVFAFVDGAVRGPLQPADIDHAALEPGAAARVPSPKPTLGMAVSLPPGDAAATRHAEHAPRAADIESAGAPTTPEPEPVAELEPDHTATLALRDQWFDVALAADLDPRLWERADVREAFAVNRRICAAHQVLDSHRDHVIECYLAGVDPMSLEDRLRAAVPDVIPDHDAEAWWRVAHVDAQYGPMVWTAGDDLDWWQEIDGFWELRGWLMTRYDPLGPLLEEIGK